MIESNKILGSVRVEDGRSTNVIAEDAEGLHHADHVPKHFCILLALRTPYTFQVFHNILDVN